ncbi:alanine racemase [Paucidesulfovibrio gracilis DSM 16080]|uniref:Alanine racemase n=1 Tax=Paucidesulfovibrio gracilis DSM 16080 TaxID=1121449 RepID=A0A1T4X396_9BACT|nr:alanine racemase [Paucidesulfovibrio gracilis]SKA83535.1 alanine racemase [Paucidesulfovibrio gracilis DSM 16080]
MAIPYNKLRVQVDLNAIRHNYRQLSTGSGNTFAVVKADAYGHGLIPVARALAEEGADTFAVGTVGEAVHLRESGCTGRILSLLGPVDSDDYAALAPQRIIPFVGNWEQLVRLKETAAQNATPESPLEISLKFDTGMARLGFHLEDVPRLLSVLTDAPGLKPVMASSHLATADEPDNWAFAREQGDIFQAVLDALRHGGLDVEGNLANTAGILAHGTLHHQGRRAGIGLYGCNPFAGTEHESLGAELRPAMEVTAPVVEVHPLAKGRSVSYGCTWKAPRDCVVAIVATGYADAYSRGLSNRGSMCLNGTRVPIAGRVCMQLTAVDVTDLAESGHGVQVGDQVHLLGGRGPGKITPEELADWWGTITYEVFCLLGLNPKEYR